MLHARGEAYQLASDRLGVSSSDGIVNSAHLQTASSGSWPFHMAAKHTSLDVPRETDATTEIVPFFNFAFFPGQLVIAASASLLLSICMLSKVMLSAVTLRFLLLTHSSPEFVSNDYQFGF